MYDYASTLDSCLVGIFTMYMDVRARDAQRANNKYTDTVAFHSIRKSRVTTPHLCSEILAW
jgi:hypothetical protein